MKDILEAEWGWQIDQVRGANGSWSQPTTSPPGVLSGTRADAAPPCLRLSQGVSMGAKANILAAKYGFQAGAALKFPMDTDGKAKGVKLLADANAGYEGKRLHIGQLDVGYSPKAHGLGAALGYRFETHKHENKGGAASTKAFLEGGKEALGEEMHAALMKALKEFIEEKRLGQLLERKVEEKSNIVVNYKGLLDYNGMKNFGTKGSVLDDLRGNDDFCMYDLEPPVAEHLKVAVGRREGAYKDKVKIMVQGHDEEGKMFIVNIFIDAEGKMTDDGFKGIDERLVTF